MVGWLRRCILSGDKKSYQHSMSRDGIIVHMGGETTIGKHVHHSKQPSSPCLSGMIVGRTCLQMAVWVTISGLAQGM